MSAVALLQPILDDRLQRNNFFNGRLLSAEDLRAEQDATRAALGGLARAVGDGVAWGLEVAVLDAGAARPRVTVGAGLALDRLGDLLSLAADHEVALVPEPDAIATAAGVFGDCERRLPPTALGGAGVYVLALSPTSALGTETALVSDPNATALGRGACGPRWRGEGVRFRLVRVPLDDDRLALVHPERPELAATGAAVRARLRTLLASSDARDRARLRNLLAHCCLGTAAHARYLADPLAIGSTAARLPVWGGWGLLDAMRDARALTDCDVPLALLLLTDAGLEFVDEWAARRRPVDAGAVASWRGVVGPRRASEGEAAFLQFQAQLDGLLAATAPATLAARDWLDVLPSVGWLPTGAGGVDWRTFLGAHAPPAVTEVDAALLRAVVARALHDDPFALATDPPVPLRVHQVPGEAFVVFARAHAGSVRVRLTPAPDAAAAVQVTTVADAGPTARATARAGGTVLVPELAPGRHTVTVVAAGYEAVAPRAADVVGGRTVDVDVALVAQAAGTIVVRAVDGATGADLSTAVGAVTGTGGGGTFALARASDGRWRATGLRAGAYQLSGTAGGYPPASVAVTLTAADAASGAAPVEATLTFARAAAREEPPRCVTVDGVLGANIREVRLCLVLAATEFDRAYFYEERATKVGEAASARPRFRAPRRTRAAKARPGDRAVTATGEIVYGERPWRDMTPVDPLPAKVRAWLLRWRDWFADELGDRELALVTPELHVDVRWSSPLTATQVPERPAGYAVFGRFGVPVTIARVDDFTRAPVALEEAGMRGLTPDLIEALKAVEVDHVDDLAHAWAELVADATGDPVINPARHLVLEAAQAVARINADRTYYRGMDREARQVLHAAGLDDDVALANADAERLGERLGSVSFAYRLVEQARAIVPRDAWALADLGLTGTQEADLVARGIESKGMLAERARTVAGRAVVADVLGVERAGAAERDAAVAELADAAVVAMAERSVALAPTVRVAQLGGVTPTATRRLEAAGLGTAEALAAADPAAVATAAAIAPADAARLVTAAKGATRSAIPVGMVAPVTRAEERQLATLLGAEGATLGAVAARTAEQLAPAFGGNVARAAAVLRGVQAGLARGGMR